ncbi:hypothetical protein BC941DRAFT_410307 [Chlamydoabsidia padenii]|nr:hypothetical protein BC941DRAFT_410307 [Chlamydoabsidia padenii]
MYAEASFNNVMAQKSNYSFLNVDPFPFTNANLDDPLNMPSMDEDDYYDSHPSSKKPLSKDERRAEHNAIERARRESLNNKFQQLAQALPNLINYRRPSKSQIVEKALDWVKKSISREERYRYQIVQLQKENKQLMAQLMNGTSVPSSPTPTASVSTPTTNKRRQQQQNYHPLPTSPTTDTSLHHSNVGTSMSAMPSLYDLTPLLTAPTSPLSTPHVFSSLDDLHQSSFDRKELDPALFQSPTTDLYLESMLLSNHHRLPPSPGFIQPMASRSTPSFSSRRR